MVEDQNLIATAPTATRATRTSSMDAPVSMQQAAGNYFHHYVHRNNHDFGVVHDASMQILTSACTRRSIRATGFVTTQRALMIANVNEAATAIHYNRNAIPISLVQQRSV
jgi:hypothetical protein